MNPSVLYRVASGLLFLFAAGHTLGFTQADPEWGVSAVVGAMQSSRFTIQGFSRTYWDFFLGAGFTVGVLYLFAAVLAWQLSGLPLRTLASMRATAWGFAVCFVAVSRFSVPSTCFGFPLSCLVSLPALLRLRHGRLAVALVLAVRRRSPAVQAPYNNETKLLLPRP